jgi:phosphotransferase system HPr-like phosphotransfer protein
MKRSVALLSAEDARAILLQKGTTVSKKSTLVLVLLSIAKGDEKHS